MGPKAQAAFDEIMARLDAQDERIDDHEARLLDAEDALDFPVGPLMPIAPLAWRDTFDISLLPEDESYNHHGELITHVPVRLIGDDAYRDIVRVIGWQDGAQSGVPHSAGYRIEHLQRFGENDGWTQRNALHFLIGSDGNLSGKSLAQGSPNGWPVDVTDRYDFAPPITVDESLPIIGELPEVDCTGIPNGTHVAWWQVKSTSGKVSVVTVICWDEFPYLTLRGKMPSPQEWFDLRGTHARATWKLQREFVASEVFPA